MTIGDFACISRTSDARAPHGPRCSPSTSCVMAQAALMSPAHFSRKVLAAYARQLPDDPSHRRAKALLRQGMSVTDACMAVGCTSPGRSSRFTEIVGDAVAVPLP